MINSLLMFFSFPFIIKALIVGVLVSLCAALLGVNLVLKRYSMIGDGLSHVGFGALSIAIVLNLTPLAISVPVVIIAALFLLKINQNSHIKSDAAIAIVSSSALAIGIIVASLNKGVNIDINNYLFGSILSMDNFDVYLSIGISILVLVLYMFFYNKILMVTFDQDYAKATGIKAEFYNTLIALLTASTIVVGMRIMGTLLISSLIIFPALTSMRVFKSFKSVIICSGVVSVVCFFIGIVASFIFEIPAGASVVVINLIMFLLFWAVKKMA